MNITRRLHAIAWLGAVLGALMATLAVSGAAQAATPSMSRAGGHAIVAPPAPSGVQVAGVAPSISPAVSTKRVGPFGAYTCPSGTLCAWAWDSTTSTWLIFNLFKCSTYALSNWVGGGAYQDAQTGGVRSTFYGRTGNALKSFTPDGGAMHQYDWTSVWFIKNC